MGNECVPVLRFDHTRKDTSMRMIGVLLSSCMLVKVARSGRFTNLSWNEQLGFFLIRRPSDDQLQGIDLDPWVSASYPAPHASWFTTIPAMQKVPSALKHQLVVFAFLKAWFQVLLVRIL